jgi:hypothetical protein
LDSRAVVWLVDVDESDSSLAERVVKIFDVPGDVADLDD